MNIRNRGTGLQLDDDLAEVYQIPRPSPEGRISVLRDLRVKLNPRGIGDT